MTQPISTHPLVERIRAGDRRAVARALTLIENEADERRALLLGLYPFAGKAHVVGFTGSPGAGKSTLVDGVIELLRGRGLRVGVLAVDPSSPFTGGALLGDRVRMIRHSGDEGVYIRSMGTRGSHGGLAAASREMLYPLEAFGCDVILLETVGVGQAELDIMRVADTVALVLTPGAGDHVQTAKAGIMEIADLFVVNKADLPGADTLVRELQLMLHGAPVARDALSSDPVFTRPIVRTTATAGQGLVPLWESVAKHGEYVRESGLWEKRQKARFEEESLRRLVREFERYAKNRLHGDEGWQGVLQSMADTKVWDPDEAVYRFLQDLPWLLDKLQDE